jgi:hypothetical protein
MPTPVLQSDATIADLLNSLNKPRDYIQCVYENMWECKLEYGNASVRIGITGAGRAPYYRTEYVTEGSALPSISAVYVGLGHRKRADLGNIDFALLFAAPAGSPEAAKAWPDHLLSPGHWSSRVMSLDGVGRLRADLLRRRR